MTVSNFHLFGGHGSTITKLCLGLNELGYKTSIGAFSFDSELPSGIEKIKLNRFERIGGKDSQFDIIHNHHPIMNYYSLFSIKPFIFHLHGASNTIQRFNLSTSMFLCRRKIARIITISNTVIEQIESSVEKIPTDVIYTGVNTKFHNTNLPETHKKGNPQLLFVGVLYSHKNVKAIIQSMPKILEEFPKAHLQIVGDGVEYIQLKNLIKTKKLENKIELLGRISDNELKLRYASCDIYISASTHEMLDLPAIEVMAYGKPVVLSDISAHKELINASESGRTYSLSKKYDMISKIKEVYVNKETLNIKARNFAEQNDWSNVSKKVSDIYQKII